MEKKKKKKKKERATVSCSISAAEHAELLTILSKVNAGIVSDAPSGLEVQKASKHWLLRQMLSFAIRAFSEAYKEESN